MCQFWLYEGEVQQISLLSTESLSGALTWHPHSGRLFKAQESFSFAMASIQLIISPVLSGDNRLVTAKSDMPVSELRALVASQEKMAPSDIRLVSAEGLELEDGASLEDFFVTNLSTIRLVIKGGSAAAPASAPELAAPPAPSAPVVSPVSAAPETKATDPSAADASASVPLGSEAVGAFSGQPPNTHTCGPHGLNSDCIRCLVNHPAFPFLACTFYHVPPLP